METGEPYIPIRGDANCDEIADGADYTLWADQYGKPGGCWAHGDFNGDGDTGGADYTIWADNYAGGGSSVPEPGAPALVALGACLPLVQRRR